MSNGNENISVSEQIEKTKPPGDPAKQQQPMAEVMPPKETTETIAPKLNINDQTNAIKKRLAVPEGASPEHQLYDGREEEALEGFQTAHDRDK